MRKVLLTSIGTGKYDEGEHRYKYNKAKYSQSEDIFETPYIFDALVKFNHMDAIVFIGTTGSNWAALYQYVFSGESTIQPVLEYDENYFSDLHEWFMKDEHAGIDTILFRDTLQKLKDTLGDKCLEIVVLKYGLTEQEIVDNFAALAAISDKFQDKDSISFDITHSFRSLAMYEMLAVNYFMTTANHKKNIHVDHVYYGMLEYSRENKGIAPITDQTKLIDLIEWTNAGMEYVRFGTTYLFCDLLEKNRIGGLTSSEINALKLLGDRLVVDDLNSLKQFIIKCEDMIEGGEISRELNPVMRFVFDDIYRRFADVVDDDMLLSVELAKWHMEKHRHLNAAVLTIEAMLKYCRGLTNMKMESIRNALKVCKASGNFYVRSFVKYYNKVRVFRNNLCHATPLSDTEVERLSEYIKVFSSIYKKQFMNIKENREYLQKVLTESAEESNKCMYKYPRH